MLWCDRLAERLDPAGTYVINDSKTPSGRVHVGALRGVLIHDAMFRTLRERGFDVRYWFGVDDYDPVDEIPYGEREHFARYLGMPLCAVPPPPGSDASDMADHYISEFFGIFPELGVEVETYRTRDCYRSGRFNEAIDRILQHAAEVREVYRRVSGSERPATWYPYQAVCENCGRIGTTEVSAYDGKEVEYHCRPDLVTWATGCGHHGKVSPFDGGGKLPWKLEWVAKWHTFPVGIEGAGKDHSTKGGSRDVASACLRRIFQEQPPLNIPYEFFLVQGAKMSSSRGVGVSARGMADFLPPEVLRFLMLRTQPNRPVNFSPTEAHIVKLFNDFDRHHSRYHQDPEMKAEERRVYQLAQVRRDGDFFDANFQLVVTLVQMPHLDLEAEIAKQKGSALSDVEKRHLARRAEAARYWVEHYAEDSEKTYLQETLPASAETLNPVQRAFLHQLGETLADVSWEAEAIQTAIFESARLTPVRQGDAFRALYTVLLSRTSGPKAGNLLSCLGRAFVIGRCREVAVNEAGFLAASSITVEAWETWLAQNGASLVGLSVARRTAGDAHFLDCLAALADGKREMKRLRLADAAAAEALESELKASYPSAN